MEGLLKRIVQQSSTTPEAIAVQCGESQLSYRQLEALSNQYARHLQQLGVGAGCRVALLLPRSCELVAAILGVLKTGAAYVPLDPQYPQERLSLIFDDCAASLLITRSAFSAGLPGNAPRIWALDSAEPLTELDDTPVDLPDDPDAVIYLIYTSGSTGRPKGCINFHRGALNLYQWFSDEFSMGPHTRFVLFTSIGFDLTQKNIFAPLMSGGRVVLLDGPHYDAAAILNLIDRVQITGLGCTPSGLFGLIDDADERVYQQLASIREVCVAGEALVAERIAHWLRHPSFKAHFVNGFGPSECSDFISFYRVTEADLARGGPVPIGRALPNLALSIRDATLKPLLAGAKGELCVSGVGVGGGYLNLPERTAEVFVDDPQAPGTRIYRTGDLCSQRADGLIEFHGRLDHQVKIRGFRIELPEVENLLRQAEGVREAIVAAPKDAQGNAFLAAYVQAQPGATPSLERLRAHCARQLPEYMVPTAWRFVDAFEMTASGKINRLALPAIQRQRPPMAQAYRAAQDALQQRLQSYWQELLGFDEIGVADPFFELGGTSLQAITLLGRLRRELQVTVPVARFFAAPTIQGLARHLAAHHAAAVEASWGIAAAGSDAPNPARMLGPARNTRRGEVDIAIVGMAGKFPGAANVEQFWQMLVEARDGIRLLSADQLAAAGVPEAQRADPDYVAAAGWLDDADCFDAAFFGYAPREAALIDPQQRVLLETALAALEHAGCDPERFPGRIGVYAGVARNQYFAANLASHAEFRTTQMDPVLLGNDKDYAASRIAYRLNLHGPALSAQTACSSSGVAIHLACQALREGDCEAALVGGASIPVPFHRGHTWIENGPLSRDGKVRPFDAQASGMMLTAGAACLLLKPLDLALAQGDTVYAVIKGSALNNDGADKAAFSAPSVQGQRWVLEAALNNAGLRADQISYVEAHGTGTPVGDPIEVAALTETFRQHTDQNGVCALGSVKSNIGHLDAGAAAAGLIKTALALHHRVLPASLHFERPNPELQLEQSPFRVQARTAAWDSDGPRRAGLSSFGFGGTNFHAVLEQAEHVTSDSPRRFRQLLRWSARREELLSTQAEQLQASLSDADARRFADAAYTLERGRLRHANRAVCVVQHATGTADLSTRMIKGKALEVPPQLVFGFPGQGAQHPGMGQQLFESEAVWRDSFQISADVVREVLDVDLRALIFDGQADAAEQLRATQLAQPAIFAVSLACARLWQSWGYQPTALIGHSVGEFVAATLAGVFEQADAVRILCERARLMQAMPAGGMMAVRLPAEELQAELGQGVDLAGINAPGLSIVAGPHEALDELAARLEGNGVGLSRLHTSHAFHSEMMTPAVEPFAEIIARYPRKAPNLPIVSTVTGDWATAEMLQDPQHWARQLREPVRFAPALAKLLETPGRVLLECGPGQNLTTSARQSLRPAHKAVAVASLPHPGAEAADAADHFLEAAGRLWIAGVEWDATQFWGDERRQRIGLPTYPFLRTRHWIDAATSATHPSAAISAAEPAVDSDTSAASATGTCNAIHDALLPLMQSMTGLDFSESERDLVFLELGLDSLMLTQVVGRLKAEFKVELRFRQLLDEFKTFNALAAWLGSNAQGKPGITDSADKAKRIATAPDPQVTEAPVKASFGAMTRISRELRGQLNERQQRSLSELMRRYLALTGKSRAYAEKHRPQLADPRTVSGFRPLIKELIYPIVSERSEGPYIWDLDGNRYVDCLNGYGSVFFGHRPEFVRQAISEQMERGWEIGPQTPLAGECAQMFCEQTQNERVAFCNTGSEAVLAAVRLARTVSGRQKVVMFSGDYHGINDEVIVRAGGSGRSVPAAPGIPPESVANTLILDYGDDTALEKLRACADEVAAVLVEPVQSRRPDWQPKAFMHELRRITEASESALIFDEVITGFRSAPGGAQEYFGVRADIASYGKVFGGGLPIGAVAGRRKYLDALDGGSWQFGDDSAPEVGVTYFAGTFVRHPMTMAAVRACLKYLAAHPQSQALVNRRTEELVSRLNDDLRKAGAPMHIARFSSLWKPEYSTEQEHGDIFFYFLREAGLHIWEGRPCFLTLAHEDEHCEQIIEGFRYAIDQTQRGDFFSGGYTPREIFRESRSSPYLPPVPGARPGRDADGNPAWFVPDPSRPGAYLRVDRP